ncbi:MAG TPA: hypothetical protein VN323_21855, partial [Candidatus Dormibacteraeota bacterium]|nr:hypothetical protein [Candidatus Dormibacteraeota bacterium]
MDLLDDDRGTGAGLYEPATSKLCFNVWSVVLLIEVAPDQAPEQVVDLHAMVAYDLGDVRVTHLLFGSFRQRRTRQVTFGQRAESASVHRPLSLDQTSTKRSARYRPFPTAEIALHSTG